MSSVELCDRAVSDDLELMVRENQQLSDQLASAQAAIEKLTEQQCTAQTTIANLEQFTKIKETDLEDIRQAYEVAVVCFRRGVAKHSIDRCRM